ncbi:hypothetical protein ABBQ38_006196 [Trebouxia sp. C0009 RCD-2024]
MEECCAWEQTGYRSLRRRINPGRWQDIPQLSSISYLSFTDVLHQVPRLLELVAPNDKKTLLAVCASIRQLVHPFASYVSLQEDDTLQHLLDTAAGPRLQVLELHNVRLTLTAILELTSAPWAALLTGLTLSNCGLNSSIISKLAAGDWPVLKHLSFSNNKLSTTGIKAMAGGNWPRLEHLDLSSNKLNAEAITHLTRLGWSRLSGLELHDNPDMDAKALRRLASGPWPLLKGLGISGQFSLSYLVTEAAFAWPLLDSVYLACDGPPQAVDFAGVWQNMRNMQIKTQCPSWMPSFSMPVMLELIEADWRYLQSLDLSYSHLGSEGLSQLFLGKWPLLSQLDVSHLRLARADFRPSNYKGLACGTWPQLTHLCLSHNWMDDDCAAELVNADWPKLQTLDLSYNDIGATGSASLAQGDWPAMEHLCLHGNKPECVCPCCVLQDGF